VSNDGLSGFHFNGPGFGLNLQHASQHNCVFIERWPLTGLDPSTRARHLCDADGSCFGIHMADELFDNFRLVAGGFDNGRS